MIEPNQITEPNKAKPKFLDAMDEMLKNPTPQMEAFYSGLRKKGGWGQDEGGLYYQHPDDRKEYKESPRA